MSWAWLPSSRLGKRALSPLTSSLSETAHECERMHRSDCSQSQATYFSFPTGTPVGHQLSESERAAARDALFECFSFPGPDHQLTVGLDSLRVAPFGHLDLARASHKAIVPLSDCANFIAEAESARQWREALSIAHFANNASTFIAVKELPRARNLLNHHLKRTLYPAIATAFPNVKALESQHLRVSGASIVKYNATAGQCRLATHRDGPLVACMVALNDLSEYDGGGTFIEALSGASLGQSGANERVLRRSTGHVVMHPGYVRHGGAEVTRGVRYVLVVWVFSAALVDYSHYATVFANQYLAKALAIPRSSNSGFRRDLLEAAVKAYSDALAFETKADGHGEDYIDADSELPTITVDEAREVEHGLASRPRSEAALVGFAQSLIELLHGNSGEHEGRSELGKEGISDAIKALSEALHRAPTNGHARELLTKITD